MGRAGRSVMSRADRDTSPAAKRRYKSYARVANVEHGLARKKKPGTQAAINYYGLFYALRSRCSTYTGVFIAHFFVLPSRAFHHQKSHPWQRLPLELKLTRPPQWGPFSSSTMDSNLLALQNFCKLCFQPQERGEPSSIPAVNRFWICLMYQREIGVLA